MRRRAFSLVELMVVVLIIGILLGIAVPQWVRAREVSREKTCLENLAKIGAAKEYLAMEQRLGQGDPVNENNLWPEYLKHSSFPVCPSGGEINIGPVGTEPTCSVHGQ